MVEHNTTDDDISSDTPVRVQDLPSEVDATLLLKVNDHAIAVLPDGVVGLRHPEGSIGWSYRVPDQEPDIDVTADNNAVVVTHTVPGRWGREQVQETVLSPSTGKILHQDELSPAPPPAPDLGTDDLRILAGETLQAQWRDPYNNPDGDETDAWEVDPASFCTDGTAPDTELAADEHHVYLAADCGDGEGRLVALSPRSGQTDWEQEFTPADGAPQILLIGNELRAGPGHDPVGRALEGDFGTDHRYLDTVNGGPAFPPELEEPDTAQALGDHLTLPVSGTEEPVGTFILATGDTVDAHVVHQSVQRLIDQDLLSPADLDEGAFKDPDEYALHTPQDLAYYFDAPRNRLRAALEEFAE